MENNRKPWFFTHKWILTDMETKWKPQETMVFTHMYECARIGTNRKPWFFTHT